MSDPLTPADADLRGYEWMALMGHRLFTSTWYAKACKDGRGGIAAIKLWWVAMGQVPAGSLPNDEDELALLADFGSDLKAWRKHRAVALYGWAACSDGRLYHAVVAEQVMKALCCREKTQHVRVVDADRQRRWRDAKKQPNPTTETVNVTRDRGVTERVTDALRNADVTPMTVQDKTEPVQEKEREEDKNPSFFSGTRASQPPPDGLDAVLSDAGVTPPEPGTVGAEVVQMHIRRTAKAMKMSIPYAEVRSVEAQLDAIQPQPGAVGADETMGLKWRPADPARTVEQQIAEAIAGLSAEQTDRARRAFAARAS